MTIRKGLSSSDRYMAQSRRREPIVLTLYGPDGEVGFAPTRKVPPYHGSDPRQNI